MFDFVLLPSVSLQTVSACFAYFLFYFFYYFLSLLLCSILPCWPWGLDTNRCNIFYEIYKFLIHMCSLITKLFVFVLHLLDIWNHLVLGSSQYSLFLCFLLHYNIHLLYFPLPVSLFFSAMFGLLSAANLAKGV